MVPMKAMVLRELGPVSADRPPLSLRDTPMPVPGPADALIGVSVCGVCHTELDEIEGRTPPPRLPVILGHQVVGRVVALGNGADQHLLGRRVGVAWIFSACGVCPACQRGAENLCPAFVATGRDRAGGYAEFMAVPAAYVTPIPDGLTDEAAAPLLCAGAIGVRSLRLAALLPGERLGLTGFGASAHLVLRGLRAREPRAEVYVFARRPEERAFARELGATWAGNTTERSPVPLDAIIDTTPAWLPVAEALRNLAPGGRLVINAIRKESTDRAVLADLDYVAQLWLEKSLQSVANVTREDVRTCLAWAEAAGVVPEVQVYDLADANRALLDLRAARIRGAKVLRVAP